MDADGVTLASVGDLLTGIGTIGLLALAVLTAIIGWHEYRRRAALDQFTSYWQYVDLIETNKYYSAVSRAVRKRDPEAAVAGIKADARRRFLANLDLLDLLINSKLVPAEVAYYTFGTTVLRADKYGVWDGVVPPRDDNVWGPARHLEGEFKRLKEQSAYDPMTFRLGPAPLGRAPILRLRTAIDRARSARRRARIDDVV